MKNIYANNYGTTLNPQGLYDPKYEKDACGIGFIANIDGIKSREIVESGLKMLANLEHRGATGADPNTGDGAGILLQMPDKFLRKVTKKEDFCLPEQGRYGVGVFFLPQEKSERNAIKTLVTKIVIDEGQEMLGWRKVPTKQKVPGKTAQISMPVVFQCFIGAEDSISAGLEFERKLYLIRRIIDQRIRQEHKLDRFKYYVPSFSSRTINYKGMLTSGQVPAFYPDLRDVNMVSAMAMVHMRFSTNTMPTWDLAQPFRFIGHNGEINTLRGNINWMKTREMVMESPHFGKDIERMIPIIMEGQSDSATFDTVLELLVLAGRSLPHAIMMMIPEAWSKKQGMHKDLKGFYEYHATMMEPWDGPAAVMFSDGEVIGATLDRNGLRPARYYVTKDNNVILASEAGLLPVETSNILYKGRLEPGKIFLVDMVKKKLIDDHEVKQEIIDRRPYRKWVEDNIIRFKELDESGSGMPTDFETIRKRQNIFGYTKEDIKAVLKPMFLNGVEATSSMGIDASLAILSKRPQLMYKYFKQLFAQVTNPPVDAMREELVMELTTYIGPEGNLLDESPDHAHRLELEHPILSNSQLEKVRAISRGHFKAETIKILFDPNVKRDMRIQLNRICKEVAEKIKNGTNLIILSDRGVGRKHAPIPALLAVAGLHHYLIKQGLRTNTGIIIETGEAREVPHFALLCGYGANAINPYLAYETLEDVYNKGYLADVESIQVARKNYKKAIKKGLFKVFSKMGISTLQSYCGAQIFEAVGIDKEIIDQYFTGTYSRIEGLSLEMLEKETLMRHRLALKQLDLGSQLYEGGHYHFRMNGEKHLWNPVTISALQEATRNKDYAKFKEFTSIVNEQRDGVVMLRNLLMINYGKNSIDLSEVEPASEIVKRFSTGAMSYGSISWEAHTTLAIAMNRIGAKSNTGEGGEDPARFKVLPNGDSMRSSIKQVASGRFGVTANYLVNADELQIKMAQGAKPGEGGQLPGFKVNKIIAKTRYSTPGVTLISPPPHHDIYSIEDLKQLIFDLKNINPTARISVKLVSEVGVGTVAAGVVKAHADHVLIAGHDGGTGASPISSIHYAGTPWEIGLSETQQTLVLQGLRDRIHLATDGKLTTGKDVAIAAMLGADEFGFSTGPLISLGCIMMRKCHLNTCPVGVATQDEDLRKRFSGQADAVVNYMMFIAEEVREIMAKLGYKKFTDMIGQVDNVESKELKDNWKARGIDFSKILHKPKPYFDTKRYKATEQIHGLEKQLDNTLIAKSKAALKDGKPVEFSVPITNVDRTVGAMLSGEIAKRYGDEALPEATIKIKMNGSAGQSFGCWLAKGIEIELTGESQDYTGKGLSGGRLIIRTPEDATFDPAKNFIIGNTCFYGATSGEAFINGLGGERFCVRNSGAETVIEGIGDHGCEYMTGGRVIVLGDIGRNFAAGMSGGIAYLWDPDKKADDYINQEMVDLESLDDEAEATTVFNLITKHQKFTKSRRASYILSNWDEEKHHIIKVMPREYKLALQKLEEEKELEVESSEATING